MYLEEVVFAHFISAMLVLPVDITLWLVLRKVLDFAGRHKTLLIKEVYLFSSF